MDTLAPVASCPLCGSPRHEAHSTPPQNLYSEMLAPLVGVPEQELLAHVRNVLCMNCGLIHKDHWFPQDVLERLFGECVPSHPRGWDVLSGRFTPANFQVEVTAYGQAIDAGDEGGIRRYRRSLASIIDSIPEIAGTDESARMVGAIEAGDVTVLRAADRRLREVMREPAPYKRFSGFSASVLWDYIESRLGRLRSYAEVGCPLWGLLQRATSHGCAATHLVREEANYWSSGCRQGGMHCTERLATNTRVASERWDDVAEQSYDAIGAFQYLDHLEHPGAFMDQLFARARAAVLILDAADQPVAIQHFTGWTPDAVSWLAARNRCRIHDGFDGIRDSGNFLVILQRS